MTFEEILNQALAMLQRQGRVSYRALKRQFGPDDAYIEDLKFEIIEVYRTAVDQDNTMLVWMGGQPSASAPAAPYHPIIDLLRNNCGITDADGLETIAGKVQGTLWPLQSSSLNWGG